MNLESKFLLDNFFSAPPSFPYFNRVMLFKLSDDKRTTEAWFLSLLFQFHSSFFVYYFFHLKIKIIKRKLQKLRKEMIFLQLIFFVVPSRSISHLSFTQRESFVFNKKKLVPSLHLVYHKEEVRSGFATAIKILPLSFSYNKMENDK